MRTNIILSSKPWNAQMHLHLQERLGGDWHLISQKEDFTPEKLKEIDSEYIFIPHWSHIIPESIWGHFTCIVFHMTDLPYGRGGSPLQNLIARGHKETKISAIRVNEGIDTGDVYLKANLNLNGTAEEIFMRAAQIMEEMIARIVEEKITPAPQQGEPVVFKRRKPSESDISKLETLEEVFDYIRMLDAEGYPNAYLETEHFRFEFSRASLKTDSVIADVRITKK